MLAQTLGPGKAQVLVYANMNVNQTTKESLEYGKAGTPTQQSKTIETLTGTGTGAGGVTGTANLTTAASGANGKSNYKHETTNSSLGVSKTVTHSTIAPGTVESQHVSVLLDHSVPAASLPAIREAITNAAGIQTKRGDTISIGQVAFAKSTAAAPASSPLGDAKYVLLGLGAILFLFFTTRSLRKREKETIDEPVWLRELEAPMRLSELERETATRPAPVMAGVAPSGGGGAANGHGDDGAREHPPAGRAARRQRPRPRRPAASQLDAGGLARMAGELSSGHRPGAAGRSRRAPARHRRVRVRVPQGGGPDGRARVRARRQGAAAAGRGGDREPLDGDGQPELGRRGDDRLDLQRARRAGQHPGAGRGRGLDFARGVIERALGPERAAEVLGRLSARTETPPFDFLQRVPPERTAALLRSESPQTIALILASLQTTLAAQVLARLPERQQPDIALRIARMGETSAQVVQQVEEVIRHKLNAVAEREYSAAGGTKTLAEILNHSDRTTERNVLEKLASADEELAEEVRGMLFVFEDIVKLEERAIQQVLREADQKDLVLALRGAPENVKEVVLTNMSERGAEMLKEEMEIQPPQRKRDIDAAQSRIVAVVRKLEEAGTIVIAGGEEEESEAVV